MKITDSTFDYLKIESRKPFDRTLSALFTNKGERDAARAWLESGVSAKYGLQKYGGSLGEFMAVSRIYKTK